jgi:hypothetical protein
MSILNPEKGPARGGPKPLTNLRRHRHGCLLLAVNGFQQVQLNFKVEVEDARSESQLPRESLTFGE